MKAQSGNFRQALVHIGHAADLARQAHFADGDQIIVDGLIPVGGCHRKHHRQVGAGLVQPQTADDIDVSVKQAQLHAAPLFCNRQQQSGTVKIKTVRRPAGYVEAGFGNKRLNLSKNWPCALHHAGNAGAGCAFRAAFQQHLGGIRYFDQTGVCHFEHADLVGRAEAVLGGPEQTVGGIGITLEIENAVNHMLQHLGAGDVAVLIDMANHKDGDAVLLGHLHHGHSAILHLGDTAG